MPTTPLAYPGSAYPSQAHPGQAAFRFYAPVGRRRFISRDRLFRRMSLNEGLVVLKTGGAYVTAEHPTEAQINAADKVYLGGHEYLVTPDEADALTAAGYEVTT